MMDADCAAEFLCETSKPSNLQFTRNKELRRRNLFFARESNAG